MEITESVTKSELENIPAQGSFDNSTSFDHAQRVAKMLSSSTLVPKDYQGKIQNTLIALEMANRIGASPLMVMQNLFIVNGRPSWSSTFIIAAINSCKKFSPLRFEVSGEGDAKTCFAWAYDLATNDKLEGPKVSIEMAREEGWLTKAGSKWKTMPDLMIRYRAAAFFGRLYAPEILMGMLASDEVQDMTPVVQPLQKVDKELERWRLLIEDCKTPKELLELKENIPQEAVNYYEEKLNQFLEDEQATA